MQWHLLGLINRGMNEEARQDLETNIRSSDKSEWTIEAKLTWVTERTTRRAWRHTFTKSDRRQEGLSTDVNECWPFVFLEEHLVPRLSSYWKSHLPQGLMGCICALRRFIFSFFCFYFPCGEKKTQTRSTKCTFTVKFFIFLKMLNLWKRCSVLK